MKRRQPMLIGEDAPVVSEWIRHFASRPDVQEISLGRRRRLTDSGKLPRICVTPLGRFLDKIDAAGDCWEWTSTVMANGYGWFHLSVNHQRTAVTPHRYLYQLLVGPIPAGLQLDHLCRNRRCVNPDHLEPVTQAENIRRGMAPAMIRRRRRASA